MPMQSANLRPGVNTQRTLSANEAGVSISQLIRYKDGIVQSYGGWQQYVPFTLGSTIRELHAWQDIAGIKHLGVGATASLNIITAGSNNVVTPQTATLNTSATFTSSLGSNSITAVLPNSSGFPTTYNTVFFNTPISIAGQVLSGAYKIISVLSSDSFTINLPFASTANVVSSGVIPVFNSTANSAIITVSFPSHGYQAITGLYYPFYAATSITSNLTIQGPYQIATVIDTSTFTINANVQSSATVSNVTMNSSLVQAVFYVTVGPAATGTGFGAGAFGSGGFGGVLSGATVVNGTPITATDWTMDNWGEFLLSCPENGPVYAWGPNSAFQTAQVIDTAPFFNGGIFVSMPQQILVCWRSCLPNPTGFGWLAQDNLTVVWSDAEDYTNWQVSNLSAAGSFHFPTGSIIMGGLQAATQGIIWTDIDVWVMQYVGGDLIFGFNRLGSGCGLIGKHACGTLGGQVYWCGTTNFFVLGGGGVTPLNCSVWDYIFQNLNESFQSKIVCATNTAFNEVAWFFPSAASLGENDSYVKYNVLEQEWDYGSLSRTAWIDVSVLGSPIGSDPTSTIFQHEEGTVLSGVSAPMFRTGWWSLADGNELAFVDFILPDFIWGLYSGTKDAELLVTVYTADYAGGAETSHGPFTITRTTEYIPVRARGRLMSISVTSNNSEFFRLGRVRFRYATSGRR